MGYVLYVFGAVAFVLTAGWAVFVLPTPGDLSAWQLAGALVPAFIFLFGVLAILLVVRLLFYVVTLIRRLLWKGTR